MAAPATSGAAAWRAVRRVPARRGRLARASCLYAPFVVAAGPGTVWDALVVQATRDGEWWRLPFPAGFGGGDVKDFLTWLAPYAALVTLVLAAFRFRRVGRLLDPRASARRSTTVSRADLEHAQALLVVAAGARRAGQTEARRRRGAGAADRRRHGEPGERAAPAAGPRAATRDVRVPAGGGARRSRSVVELVQQLVPPGEPIYVAPRRSDLVTFSQPAAALPRRPPERPAPRRPAAGQAGGAGADRRRAAARAGRGRSSAGRRPSPREPEPNRRGRPSGSTALDDYIDRAYVVARPLRRLRGARARADPRPATRPSTRRSARPRRAGCRARAAASSPPRCGRPRSSERRRGRRRRSGRPRSGTRASGTSRACRGSTRRAHSRPSTSRSGQWPAKLGARISEATS